MIFPESFSSFRPKNDSETKAVKKIADSSKSFVDLLSTKNKRKN